MHNPVESWWKACFYREATKNLKMKKVRIVEVIESTIWVPEEVPFDRRREWAYLEKVQFRTQVVKLRSDYFEDINDLIV